MGNRSRRWITTVAALALVNIWASGASGATLLPAGRGARVAGESSPAARRISRDDAPSSFGIERDTQDEPSIAADPHNPEYIVAVFKEGQSNYGGAVADGYAHSVNGGRTWATSMLPGLTTANGGPFDRATDPVVTFGPDGAVYVSSVLFDSDDCHNAVALQVSHDHGVTFGLPHFVADSAQCDGLFDKDWLTVDTYRHSPYFGRIYVAWDEYALDGDGNTTGIAEVERWSDDGGQTWSRRATVSTDWPSVPIPVVEPDGRVVVVHDVQDPNGCCFTSVAANISTDGGRSFGDDHLIDVVKDHGLDDLQYGGLVAVSVDPTSGDLYAVWSDSRHRTTGGKDVLLTRSTNGGRNWSPTRVVDDAAATSHVDYLTPIVAAYDGTVYISYLQRDETTRATAATARFYLVTSHDHARTFGTAAPLGPTSTLAYAANLDNGPVRFFGDYTGLYANAHGLYAAWEVASAPPNGATRAHHQVTWASVPRE